jgi:hypothetical protein
MRIIFVVLGILTLAPASVVAKHRPEEANWDNLKSLQVDLRCVRSQTVDGSINPAPEAVGTASLIPSAGYGSS